MLILLNTPSFARETGPHEDNERGRAESTPARHSRAPLLEGCKMRPARDQMVVLSGRRQPAAEVAAQAARADDGDLQPAELVAHIFVHPLG
jgi:hypothetical protein